jgi:heat shock protein beta
MRRKLPLKWLSSKVLRKSSRPFGTGSRSTFERSSVMVSLYLSLISNQLADGSCFIPFPVVVSTRLVSSPTAIVSDDAGMSANMQKVMAAQSNTGEEDPLLKYMKSQAKGSLEINPGSPLIRGLLARVKDLGEVGEGEVDDEEEELKVVVKTLLDVTLVRSGFDVSDLGG